MTLNVSNLPSSFFNSFFPLSFLLFLQTKKERKEKEKKEKGKCAHKLNIYIIFFFQMEKDIQSTSHANPLSKETHDMICSLTYMRGDIFFFALSFGYLIKQIQAQVHSLFFPFGTKKSMVLKEEKGKGKKKTQIKRSKVEEGREKKK